MKNVLYDAWEGLNPFEFRAGLKQDGYVESIETEGLNPFEFRAGLKHRLARMNNLFRLNPFEFRAGLKLQAAKNVYITSTCKGRQRFF